MELRLPVSLCGRESVSIVVHTYVQQGKYSNQLWCVIECGEMHPVGTVDIDESGDIRKPWVARKYRHKLVSKILESHEIASAVMKQVEITN